MSDILTGYIAAMQWTENDTIDGAELSGDLLDQALSDCEAFGTLFESCIARAMTNDTRYDLEHVGHDLWLTRNGHGAGFWDRKLGSFNGYDIAEHLSNACKMLGPIDLYVGDDGLIYG